MAITFYAGSGSPFVWKVWLTLEHKALPYDMKMLSFQKREHKTPDYLAINPRGKVPTLVDNDVVVWESTAIVEYLEETYPERALLPKTPAARAQVRRMLIETDLTLAVNTRKYFQLTLFTSGGAPATTNDGELAQAKEAAAGELERLERDLRGDYFSEQLSLADFAIYPHLALFDRVNKRNPEHSLSSKIGPKVRAWMKRIEALPYFGKTYPPHWREG